MNDFTSKDNLVYARFGENSLMMSFADGKVSISVYMSKEDAFVLAKYLMGENTESLSPGEIK